MGPELGEICRARYTHGVVRSAILPILVLAALGIAAPGRAESSAKSGRRYLVAAIGDSLTDPRAGGGKYLRALSKRCPESRFDAYGVGGQRTEHMRWRIKDDLFGRSTPWLKKPRYTHVIVLGGINDLSAASPFDPKFDRAVDRIEQNLSYMYRVAKARGVSVVAVTLPPWGRLRGTHDYRTDATAALNSWIMERVQQGAVDHAVDIHPLLSCGDPDVLCPSERRFADDFVHWNTAGHEKVADTLYQTAFSDCL